MKKESFVEILNNIDEDIIEEAYEYKKKKHTWVKWAAGAAVLAAVVITAFVISRKDSKNEQAANNSKAIIGGIVREYKPEKRAVVPEGDKVPDWEDLTLPEKYAFVKIDGIVYDAGLRFGINIPSENIGESLGIYGFFNGDRFAEEDEHIDCEVFRFDGVPQEIMIAVKMEGKYYLYANRDAGNPENPLHPKTLGELIDVMNLDKYLKCDYCTITENEIDNDYYSLNDNAEIIRMLKECGDAELSTDMEVHRGKKVSFSIVLGYRSIYNKGFTVYEDGYVFTNALEAGYYYDIGKENAGRIISCVEKNGEETYPRGYYVIGRVVETDDTYIYVDDTDRCVNEEDGMIYKIPVDNPRISRYLKHGKVGKGSYVYIPFEGDIDTDNGNTVYGAIDVEIGVEGKDGVTFPE